MTDKKRRRLALKKFYGLLSELGKPRPMDKHDKNSMDWPKQGVYFLFDPKEERAGSKRLRVVRVGIKERGGGILWDRFANHLGITGSSIFRDHVGCALARRCAVDKRYRRDFLRNNEDFNDEISKYVKKTKFLFVDVGKCKNPDDANKLIESNSIILLSNHGKSTIDSPHKRWLGKYSTESKVCQSGLWNVKYVARNYMTKECERKFLKRLESCVKHTKPLFRG